MMMAEWLHEPVHVPRRLRPMLNIDRPTASRYMVADALTAELGMTIYDASQAACSILLRLAVIVGHALDEEPAVPLAARASSVAAQAIEGIGPADVLDALVGFGWGDVRVPESRADELAQTLELALAGRLAGRLHRMLDRWHRLESAK